MPTPLPACGARTVAPTRCARAGSALRCWRRWLEARPSSAIVLRSTLKADWFVVTEWLSSVCAPRRWASAPGCECWPSGGADCGGACSRAPPLGPHSRPGGESSSVACSSIDSRRGGRRLPSSAGRDVALAGPSRAAKYAGLITPPPSGLFMVRECMASVSSSSARRMSAWVCAGRQRHSAAPGRVPMAPPRAPPAYLPHHFAASARHCPPPGQGRRRLRPRRVSGVAHGRAVARPRRGPIGRIVPHGRSLGSKCSRANP